jgi:lysophosphatidic acid acyltransferase / lysophosphatidylinositol acyltransferase
MFVSILETVFIAEFWSGSEIILYCDQKVLDVLGKNHHFTIMNHCYEIDWLVGWHLLEKNCMLGNGRGFVKNVIKYIPIAGWFFGLSEHIFLQRSYEKDKQVIEESLQDILNYPDNSWIVMTAEGTRFTKEKHEASVKFAKERNIQPLKHHLMPRPKGFMTCVPILKKNQTKVTVLNYQLAYNPKDKVEPTLLNILKGEKVTSHVYLSVVPMEQIDATPESLINVYREKDELHESFMKYGNFYEGRNIKPIEGVKQRPRIGVLINGIFWFSLNFSFMIYYATSLILAGRFVFLLSVSSAIIALCKYHHYSIF